MCLWLIKRGKYIYAKRNDVLHSISKEYLFVELINLVYKKIDDQINVSITVKYLDQQTKATQVSQFELMLENEESGNWYITK